MQENEAAAQTEAAEEEENRSSQTVPIDEELEMTPESETPAEGADDPTENNPTAPSNTDSEIGTEEPNVETPGADNSQEGLFGIGGNRQ